MLGIVKEINGEKKIIPLTTDTGTGASVGTLIQQYKKKPMSGYLYCDGSTFDENAYPAFYMYLGSNVLPDYSNSVENGYVYIKATSGLMENQQDNVLKSVKDYVDNSNSYSTNEIKTGGTWIDGKPIYRKVVTHTLSDALVGLVVIQHNIQNIETPIRVAFGKATVPGGSGSITIPAQYDSTTFVQLGAFSDTHVQLFAGSTNWTDMKEITLCLEYTKTTD